MNELLHSYCRQSEHYIVTKYHLRWLHLLLKSNKLHSEYFSLLATSTFRLVVKTEKFSYSFLCTVGLLFQLDCLLLFRSSKQFNSLNKLFNIKHQLPLESRVFLFHLEIFRNFNFRNTM